MKKTFFIGLFALGLAGCETAMEMQPGAGLQVAAPSQVNLFSDIQLQGRAADGFDEFRADAGAYGAMHINQAGTYWYWRTGSFTEEDVRIETKAACEALSGEQCLLYATIEPTVNSGGPVVPARTADDLIRAYDATEPGNYMVVATMPTGAYGYAYNYADVDFARNLAVSECRSEVAAEAGEFPKDVAARLSSQGIFDCRVLFTIQK